MDQSVRDPSNEDVPTESVGNNSTANKAQLSEEERHILELELQEVENDIVALRHTLHQRINVANQIKSQLGYNVLTEMHKDLVQGIQAIRLSGTYVKTSEVLKVAAQKTTNVLEEAKEVVKNSGAYKSVHGAVNTAYTGVVGTLTGQNKGASTQQPADKVEEGEEVHVAEDPQPYPLSSSHGDAGK